MNSKQFKKSFGVQYSDMCYCFVNLGAISMILLFYHFPLQQNSNFVTSFCMQLHFRKERSKYHCDKSVLPVTKKEVLRKANRHQPSDEKQTCISYLNTGRLNSVQFRDDSKTRLLDVSDAILAIYDADFD